MSDRSLKRRVEALQERVENSNVAGPMKAIAQLRTLIDTTLTKQQEERLMRLLRPGVMENFENGTVGMRLMVLSILGLVGESEVMASFMLSTEEREALLNRPAKQFIQSVGGQHE